eukprot:3109154-Amphidinium_carterae.1
MHKFLMVAEQRSQDHKHTQNFRPLVPIAGLDFTSGSHLEQETERFISLSKVILHRLLSLTEGESHALAPSLMWIPTMETAEHSVPCRFSSKATHEPHTHLVTDLGQSHHAMQVRRTNTTPSGCRQPKGMRLLAMQRSQMTSRLHQSSIVRGQPRKHLLLNMEGSGCHLQSCGESP